MRSSRILKKLRNHEPVLVTTVHFTDRTCAELTSLMGFDGIWLDLEHHGYSVETAADLMLAARSGASDIMARPGKGEFMRMGRLLEAGASGILYPRCDSAAEAREVVRWSKFAPLGQRGFDGGNADMPYCSMPMTDYLRAANEQTFVAIQIEDPRALEQVEEIAAVDGVDIIFLGPADFSILSGVPGQFDHPVIEDAMRRISAAVARHGKHWGMPTFSVEHARKIMGLGARLLAHSADLVHVLKGQRQMQADFGPLGFSFDRRLP